MSASLAEVNHEPFPVDFNKQVEHPLGSDVYQLGFSKGLELDPVLTVSEWSEKNRILPSKSSSEPGRWRNSRTPYLTEIMDHLSPSLPTEKVIFMKPSQIGGTEMGNNWTLFSMLQAPGPMLMVQPTVELSKRWSVQRLAPSIQMIPQLQELVGDPKARASNNTILTKEFGSGGVLVCTGANSAVGLRSMPVRYLFGDEISAWPADCGEGDPLSLAEKRTTTYARRKIFLCSTPTIKGICRIEREYQNSTQKKFFVPCPFCKHKQPLEWKGIVWDKSEDGEHLPDTAKYECQECHKLIPESRKTSMMKQGEWISQNPEANPKIQGYSINGLYSPVGWRSWAEQVKDFLKCKDDRFLLKAWTNSFGETWEEMGEGLQWEYIFTRREDYSDEELPSEDIVLITAGVDTQDDRLAVQLLGYTHDHQIYSLLYQELYGDPGTQIPWNALDEILERKFKHPNGVELNVASAFIDSGGHHADAVYRYCSSRSFKRIHPIKGSNQAGKPIINKPTKLAKGLGLLYTLGVDTAKEQIYSFLKNDTPGPNFVHFPITYDQEYFRQLTAEKVVTRLSKGHPVRSWVKVYRRNEALDTFVYGYSAFLNLNPNLELLKQKVSKGEHIQSRPKPKPRQRVKRSNGWVTGMNRF
tara:strand:- start:1395 stop:3314 length:1920 start_codon:yes stop_codon:yes gene_type:complete